MSEIKDSGKTREFETGAHRDCAEDKGRMDLVPLEYIPPVLLANVDSTISKKDGVSEIINCLSSYQKHGDITNLVKATAIFSIIAFRDKETAIMEASKQYEGGAKKYGANNWRKGMPFHVYLDSGLRHLMKWSRGDTDEPHDRAFMWNMMSLMWTSENKPELNDFDWTTN